MMDQLHRWLEAQLAERRTEPNSGLGKAITYLLRHWRPLTLFLRQAGAPLDNNIVERALKRVVLHRKNALFYRTLNGAQVGDLFMSLIHSCELAGVNAFDYLSQLQRHTAELAANPTGPVGGGPACDTPGTGPSRSRLRLTHRGARSDHSGRSRDGCVAGRIRQL